jgi:hypothetical protein
MAMRNELKPTRREREIGLEQPVELQERLVVERDDKSMSGELDAGRRREAELDRVLRGSPESCFLRVKRSSCAAATISAVLDQRGGAVVVDRPRCPSTRMRSVPAPSG